MRAQIKAAQKAARRATRADITYTRDAESIEISVGRGQARFETQNDDGLIVQFVELEWLVDVADLVLSDALTEPEEGDVITHVDPDTNKTYTYRVMRIYGEKSWRYSGPYRTQFRIHSKLVDEV